MLERRGKEKKLEGVGFVFVFYGWLDGWRNMIWFYGGTHLFLCSNLLD